MDRKAIARETLSILEQGYYDLPSGRVEIAAAHRASVAGSRFFPAEETPPLPPVEAGDEITGSLVIDALLYHKRRQAAERGIRWQCDAKLPKDCQVKEIDLCIIVGNALDNALEACGKLQETDHPFIQVYLEKVKKCLFMEVRNSAEAELGWEKKGSRKKPGAHGLGLGNIKAAVAGYNGTMHVEAENGVFTISILMPM